MQQGHGPGATGLQVTSVARRAGIIGVCVGAVGGPATIMGDHLLHGGPPLTDPEQILGLLLAMASGAGVIGLWAIGLGALGAVITNAVRGRT